MLLRWKPVAAAAGVLVAVATVLATLFTAPATSNPSGTVEAAPDSRPNIVLILMDDFSTELLETMPNALQMRSDGAYYKNAFVIDSLCCPSRAALFTGQHPIQPAVLTNTANNPTNPIA